MRAFNVRISIPYYPTRTLIVIARDSAAALLLVLESVPMACAVTVRAQ